MDELSINRANNLFRNQGYMMRLTGQSGDGFMGSLARGISIGSKYGKRRRARRRSRRQKGGVLSAIGPILGAIGPGYNLGKFIGKKLNRAFGKKKRRRK